jgi:hypothetical protein
MAEQVQWHLSGDYFENCNCSVVCPCLVSKAAPLTSRPTEGVCNVPLIFHIESGKYGGIALDGLNVALAIHTPGPMAEGNWSVAAYIDQRADDKQTEALGAIFTGAAGGPMAALAPRRRRYREMGQGDQVRGHQARIACDPTTVHKSPLGESWRAGESAWGHSRRGRTDSKSGHVPYATKAEVNSQQERLSLMSPRPRA